MQTNLTQPLTVADSSTEAASTRPATSSPILTKYNQIHRKKIATHAMLASVNALGNAALGSIIGAIGYYCMDKERRVEDINPDRFALIMALGQAFLSVLPYSVTVSYMDFEKYNHPKAAQILSNLTFPLSFSIPKGPIVTHGVFASWLLSFPPLSAIVGSIVLQELKDEKHLDFLCIAAVRGAAVLSFSAILLRGILLVAASAKTHIDEVFTEKPSRPALTI